MKTTHTFSLRIPKFWAELGSADVRAMLGRFLQHPAPLPPDPGPGEARLSLSLPARAVKVVSALLEDSESGALRRIIAANAGSLPATATRWLPDARPKTRVLEAEIVRPRALPSRPSSPFEPPADWEPQADPKWRAETWRVQHGGKMAKMQPAPAGVPKLKRVLWEFFLAALPFLGFILLAQLSHSPASPGGALTQPQPRFQAWSPK